MAGYFIYSLDFPLFTRMVERPTKKQLLHLAQFLSDELDSNEGEFDEGDPVQDWPSDLEELAEIAAQRLALSDWYGDLSDVGKTVWEQAFRALCVKLPDHEVHGNGFYWPVIEVARKALKLPLDGVKPDVAVSAFGLRPFRYNPPVLPSRQFLAYRPNHSMHIPDEVERMLEELKSIESEITNSGDEETIRDYEQELMPSLETIAKNGRMLFVQVDT